MSLIPIIFKSDSDQNAKKGKVRAEDMSALFAFSLSNKSGILDLLNKCEAYNLTVSGGSASFYLHSGYIVICGRAVYIEEGTAVNIALPASGTETGYFGVKIDLGMTADGECTFFKKEGTLVKNDLNENPVSGVYEFAIYSYQATPSSFSFRTKVADEIKKTEVPETALSATFTSNRDGTIDRTKTIDEKFGEFEARLTAQGFNVGDDDIITGKPHVTITAKEVRKIGNAVYGKIVGSFNINQSQSVTSIVDLPAGFIPKTEIAGSYGLGVGFGHNVAFKTDGSVVFSPTINGYYHDGTYPFSILFGFETEQNG